MFINDKWTNRHYEGIHYTRFIVSYAKKGGKLNFKFKEWLKSLEINGKPIPEKVVDEIYFLGTNGKMELEDNAGAFINSNKTKKEES